MDRAFYFDHLYPLQDQILRSINREDEGFYVTGGTAASRGYLNHRFSDDLDLFVNDDARFPLLAERVIQTLSGYPRWNSEVLLREARFVRCAVTFGQVSLKIKMVNDVPAHLENIVDHPILGRLDNAENILANKVTALIDREEPKDLADILGFCCRLGISLHEAIEGAGSKAAGIFPADLARLRCSTSHADWELVRWTDPPPAEQFLADLRVLGESLVL